MTESTETSRGARTESGEDKSLLNSDDCPEYEYEVDELYQKMGSASRATCFIVFVISFFGEMCAPFGVLAPVLQTEVPPMLCKGQCNGTEWCEGACPVDVCDLDSDLWRWENKHRTLISEFNLNCKNSLYKSVAGVVFFVPGMAIGLLFAGYLSDKIGRKKANMITMAGSAVVSLVMGFSNSYEMFLVFQALLGLTLGGTMVTRVVWMLEFIAESVRPYASAISAQFFCIGTVLVAVADMYLEDWRMLDFIISGYSAIYVVAMVFIPESPHWLVTNQRDEELRNVIKKLNNMNTKKISLKEVKIVPVTKHKESGNICVLFSDKKIFITVLGLVYQWFLASFLYYGFFNLAGKIQGSVQWNIAIMGILEGPCILLGGLATTKLGRKFTLAIMLIVVIVSSFIACFDANITRDWTLRRVFTLIGSKFGSGPMFFVVYILTLEVLPTSIRAVGMSTCSLIARGGAAFGGVAVNLGITVNGYLNYVVFIGACLIGLAIAYLLPETKGNTLKQTVRDQRQAALDHRETVPKPVV